MYGYTEPILETSGGLLRRISQKKLFEFILQQEVLEGGRYTSPFRKDSKPDCRIEKFNGLLYFVDFGDAISHRDGLKAIMDMQGVSLSEAMEIIKSLELEEDIKISLKPDEIIGRTEIYTNRVPFQKKDIGYWNKSLITIEQLEIDNVYASNRIRINNHKKNKDNSFSICGLCYTIDFFDAIKVYQPYSLYMKFLTTCNENHIGNYDNLSPDGDTLLITKSYKDSRIFRNLWGSNVIWFQSEGVIPSMDRLISLVNRFRRIIVFFDNDFIGVKYGYKLVKILNELRMNSTLMRYIPLKYKYKDIGEFVSGEGRRDTIQFLNQIL